MSGNKPEPRAIVAVSGGRIPSRASALAGRGLSTIREMAARANRRGALDWTSLHIAALGDRRREAEWLISQGSDVNARDRFGHTPLFFARSAYMAQALICHGADANARREDGGTALHRAARMGSRQVTKVLLESGADPSAEQRGTTPLHVAARHGRWTVAELLIKHGADIDAIDDRGRTALDIARDAGHENVARLLVRKGAAQ